MEPVAPAPVQDQAVPKGVTQKYQKAAEIINEQIVMLHAQNWQFTPDTIRLQSGKPAKLHLMGVDGNHGIEIPALGISATMYAGENTFVDIPTDTPGTYEFFCNVSCGSGHKDMVGTIVIE